LPCAISQKPCHTVERRAIDLTAAIKSLGVYEATINLHPEVSVDLKVNVARNADSLLAQELSDEAEAKEEETVVEAASDEAEEA
jgi:large subunit ribosomal protein L9